MFLFAALGTDSYKSRPRFLTWFRVVEMRTAETFFRLLKLFLPVCYCTLELAAFKVPYFAVFIYQTERKIFILFVYSTVDA